MEMTLDTTKPLYLVKGEAERYYGDIEHSVISNEGDYLTNDPNELDGVFAFDPDDWDGDETVIDQESYDNWLREIHVSDADGELKQDKFGNWWYLETGSEWRLVDEDTGLLRYLQDIDGPDDLDGWEPRDYSAYQKWLETCHPSWMRHPSYQEVKSAYKSAQVFVPEGTAELIASRDWTKPNPDVQVDLTPRVLDSGIELVPLSDALDRGLARFVTHGEVPVLEVLHFDSGPQWRDVHAFNGATKYTNRSAAQLPYQYDNPENPVCQSPNGISDWYIGYVHNDKSRWTPGYGSYVKWTISPLGLDWTSGGHSNCTLEEAAYLVGAISSTR
jgi:hypothetical protein